jgi:large subunit ribosomal protein L17
LEEDEMRHLKDHRRLGRPTDQRLALLRSLVIGLFRHNHIKTTLPKAKEARRVADRLITLAKRGDLAARRQVLKTLPHPQLVGYLFEEVAPRFKDRPGGYTRIVPAGQRRGDAAQMAILELSE